MTGSKRFFEKLWGWGQLGKRMHLSEKPGVVEYLRDKGLLKGDLRECKFSIDKAQLSQIKISSEVRMQFEKSLAGKIDDSNFVRLAHAGGKSYRDLLRMRRALQGGSIELAPDLVVFPTSTDEVKKVVELCHQNSLALVPFGGGSSVVGGLEPLCGKNNGVVVLNMLGMDRLIAVDKTSMLATFECGVLGPDLEKSLGQHQCMLGHFPQSFEFSTLGGWIAARSSGQNSLAYGGIEDMVFSLKMVTPKGEITTLEVPRMAGGPSLKEMLVGSEGIFGIITEAKVRIRPIPKEKYYYAVAFPSFEIAADAVRMIGQKELSLAMVRVSDLWETQAFMAMAGANHKKGAKVWVGKRLMQSRGIDPTKFSLAMIGIEGDREHIDSVKKEVKQLLKIFPHFSLGTSAGNKWMKERFDLPYLRDEMMDQNLFIETFETSTNWARFNDLYVAVTRAVEEAAKISRVKHVLYMHLSHLYATGVSMYFTIIAEEGEAPLDLWQNIKDKTLAAINQCGASVSHHHGVGVDHARHVHTNALEKEMVFALKKTLDPKEIMNPGKLVVVT